MYVLWEAELSPYELCGSVLFDLWSFVCVCALMHAGCDSRNLCGLGIFCACTRVF